VTQRIDRFLRLVQDRGASDLHLSVGRPPIFRVDGKLEPIRYRVISAGDFADLLKAITPPDLWETFQADGDADFGYEITGVARFRVNLFRQERGMGAVFRVIPSKVFTLKQLGLPQQIDRLTKLQSGLVLVTGPTGSGKSTTLAAMIHEMNLRRHIHIVTIEDPIEFVHENQQSVVSQREVGTHAASFVNAVRAAVREDPNVILVGEMRDIETIAITLSAAETGLLVFATLHTNSATKSIDRIINVFPGDKQDGVRGLLASVLKGVVSQQLLPRRLGGGRVAALEVLFGSPAMSNLIRERKTHLLTGLIQAGRGQGMMGMDESLRRLVENDVVDPRHALEKALDKDEIRKWLAERGSSISEAELADLSI
jgi:twitching motility protein PilT